MNRRVFLAAVAAALAGRKPAAKLIEAGLPRSGVEIMRGTGSLFNPVEPLSARWAAMRFHRDCFALQSAHNAAMSAAVEMIELAPKCPFPGCTSLAAAPIADPGAS